MSSILQVGFGNGIVKSRVIGIFPYDGHAVITKVKDAKDSGMLISLTKDKKTLSVILTDNDYIITSAIAARTLIKRMDSI